MSSFAFDPIRLPDSCTMLREEARQFLAEEISRGTYDPTQAIPSDAESREFALRVGQRGWIGITWPKAYGGQERSYLERFVLAEEFFAAHAPVMHYFVADRQVGPMLMQYASESLKQSLLPRIARGELCFSIGMSEPASGSDLFAAKARASRTEGGWLLNGTKTWVTNGHVSDYMVALFRTSPSTRENRRHGLTSFLIDMKSKGIDCRRINQMTGQRFNEVAFEDVFVPNEHLLGNLDNAAVQVTAELSYERSGPERLLESYYVLPDLIDALGPDLDVRAAEGIGVLVAQLHALRRMSVSIAGMLESGRDPAVEAAIVKDLGTQWEQQLPSEVRKLAAFSDRYGEDPARAQRLDFALTVAPKFTLAGGTNEILRGIIARGLGVR